ncbi:MAG TPA: hypothetical protein VE344_04905 [Methylomirabilota bacterium]|nr:hypothetical protein [Methylomirabilota bacterium]
MNKYTPAHSGFISDTSKFKIKEILYDNYGFAIARGHWDGDPELRLACRWHNDDEIGYPQTFGKPQWLLFPDEIKVMADILMDDPTKRKVVITLEPEPPLPLSASTDKASAA